VISEQRVATMVVLVTFALHVALATTLPLLADEAYYWDWHRRDPWALGYYDQPPLVAWAIGLSSWIGPDEIAVRGLALPWALAPLALFRHVRDPIALALCWCAPLPFALATFATPDAHLLGLTALALAAALAGGRWWLLAGVAGGLAFLAKHSGAAVLPLLVAGAGPRDWRSPWPWGGVLVAVGLAAPNLGWNAANEWVTVGYQFGQGLAHGHPPGVSGPLVFVRDQAAVGGPIAAVAAAALARGLRGEGAHDDVRVDRMLAAVAIPIFAWFALASPFGPPEAHWTAPGWVALSVAAARSSSARSRSAAGICAVITAVVTVHVVSPIPVLPDDLPRRFREGPLVAGIASEWASAGVPVYTERYQEAALIAFYAGIETHRSSGCGREDHLTRFHRAPPPTVGAVFVRPARSGGLECSPGFWQRIDSGVYDVFRLASESPP
jgi:4-amino-4-deoxy-L-arabinose transferase-like glycosyltransferase